MRCLYWILLFLKTFLGYEKIDVRTQILKRHKLTTHIIGVPPPFSTPKRRSDVFRSKIGL